MKVIDVERISTEENQVLNDNNLEEFIESPLIEPVKRFNEKGVKTLMSSCNKQNVKWINEDGVNLYTKDIKEDVMYKDLYSFGYGYAYIMMDFDSLSEENRMIMKSTYAVLNEGLNEDCDQSKAYRGSKKVIYGAVPSTVTVGQHEYDTNGFKKRPGIYFSIKTLKEDSLKTNDDFFLNNYDTVPTSTTVPRIVIMRYPVNDKTETQDVTNYFNKIADMLVAKEPVLENKHL